MSNLTICCWTNKCVDCTGRGMQRRPGWRCRKSLSTSFWNVVARVDGPPNGCGNASFQVVRVRRGLQAHPWSDQYLHQGQMLGVRIRQVGTWASYSCPHALVKARRMPRVSRPHWRSLQRRCARHVLHVYKIHAIIFYCILWCISWCIFCMDTRRAQAQLTWQTARRAIVHNGQACK